MLRNEGLNLALSGSRTNFSNATVSGRSQAALPRPSLICRRPFRLQLQDAPLTWAIYLRMMKTFASQDALASPSVARNRDPILAVLRRVLPPTGTVLEIASGTGEHAVYFAAALPHLTWQPSDQDEQALRSIAAHRAISGRPNLLAPLVLDATASDWPVELADAVVAINMVHISPWRATQGLMTGAGRVLSPGGVLYLYGAYRENGAHTAPSNEAFDIDLRRRDPDWGVRDLEEVAELAGSQGLELVERIPMPANNLSLVFRR
jgi:SAM-dependent methyltransferase